MADVDTSQEMTIADGLVIKWVDVVNLKEQDLNAQVMEPRKFDALTQNIKLRGMLESLPYCSQPNGEGPISIVSGHHRTRAAALKAAEAVPVIAKKRAGVEGVEYDIEEYSTPDAYDDPFPPAATWGPAWFAFGKSWKTIKGAQRFLALQLQCQGKGLADHARRFRIVARKSEA